MVSEVKKACPSVAFGVGPIWCPPINRQRITNAQNSHETPSPPGCLGCSERKLSTKEINCHGFSAGLTYQGPLCQISVTNGK